MSSHEEKMFNLQCQMRQNQSELQDFLKELDSWETDMKQKEQQLLTSDKEENDAKLPPVRNSLTKKKRHKIKKEEKDEEKQPSPEAQEKPQRISSYDYRAWDKFDVEKALESDGEEEEKEEEEEEEDSSDYETDEDWEMERKKQAAVLEKDAGNKYFKEGRYEVAIECYTKGFELDPTNPLLPANRAMALLKLERFAAAEMDCTTALMFDPTYVKAYLRRGASRLGLNQTEKAKADFEKVLQLEPQNATAKTELKKIERILMKDKEECAAQASEVGCKRPVNKDPKHRSTKPLRRIEVEEIGVDEDDIKSAIQKIEASQGASKKLITAQDSETFQKFVGNKTGTILTRESEEPESDRELHIPNIQDLGGSENAEEDATEQLSQMPKSSAKSAMADMYSPPVSPRTSPRIPGTPVNSYQFQTDWKVLKDDNEAIYQYLKNIPPESYHKLFGEALESNILMKLIVVFKEFYVPNGDNLYSPLCHLTTVKRFDMIVMFLSGKEKQMVSELLSHLEDKVAESELTELKRCYGIR